MCFFSDHCVPEAVAETLGAEGHEVLRLHDELPTDAPDEVVIAAAQERQAVLLSLNGDFADLVNYPPEAYSGVVALQVQNRPEALGQILDVLHRYLNEHPGQQHLRGKLLLVKAHRLQTR